MKTLFLNYLQDIFGISVLQRLLFYSPETLYFYLWWDKNPLACQLGSCLDARRCVLALRFSWFKCCKTIKTEEATDQRVVHSHSLHCTCSDCHVSRRLVLNSDWQLTCDSTLQCSTDRADILLSISQIQPTPRVMHWNTNQLWVLVTVQNTADEETFKTMRFFL